MEKLFEMLFYQMVMSSLNIEDMDGEMFEYLLCTSGFYRSLSLCIIYAALACVISGVRLDPTTRRTRTMSNPKTTRT